MDEQLTPAFPETDMELDTGAGDMRACLKIRALENKPGSIGLALVGLASFPTGNPDTYSGTETVDAGGRLVIAKRFDRVNLVVNGGYIVMTDPDEDADEGFHPTGRGEFGGGVVVRAHEMLDVVAEIFGRTVDYDIEELDPETPTEAVGAIKFYLGPGHVILGGGAGMNEGMGNPSYRAFAGAAFTWPKLDREIERPRHVTVARAVPMTSMTVDTDKDGLMNYEETKVYRTDPLDPDTDDDGLKDGDEVKTHKTDPLKADSDGDGLSDFEEVKVFYTNPLVADTDGDTLPDGVEVKQYRTSPIMVDTDEDGVNDNVDAAPLEPETINGILDWDGVPEVILAKKPSGVTLTDSIIWLPGKPAFYGPNKDKLDKPSRARLKQAAALMKEYPAVEIEVQGHTAAGGNEADNKTLSTRQSRAVAKTLMKYGISADRVAFKGYGSEFPIADNNTVEGRERNQRIDLVITEQ